MAECNVYIFDYIWLCGRILHIMKKTFKALVAIIVLVLAIWGILSMSSRTGTQEGIKNGANSPVVIGVISPMSGEIATLGNNFTNGIKLAHAEYMAAHPGADVRLVIEDDGYDQKKGISAYKKLTSVDNVDAIINLSSPTVDGLHEDVKVWNKPFIQLGEEAIHENDNIVEVYPGQRAALVALGEQAKKDGHKKISIVTQQIAAYERFIDGFEEGFGSDVTITRISPAEKDFKTFALKVANEKPDAIALFMGSSASVGFIKAYNQQNKEIPQLYFDVSLQLELPTFKSGLGNLSILEGSKGAYIVANTQESFKGAYNAKYGVDAGELADNGYDAFNVLMSAHAADSASWIANVKKTSMNGASGPIKFDEFGDRLPDYKVVTLVGGEFR